MDRKCLFLAVVLFALWPALSARALRDLCQLTASNIEAQSAINGFTFAVKAEKKADGVHFIVAVASGQATLSSFLESNLTLMDGETMIASIPVELRHSDKDKSVKAEFVVAEKYLGQSSYRFINIPLEKDGQPAPLQEIFWFHLSDFASDK